MAKINNNQPGDAFALMYKTWEQTARAIFLREGLFFETPALATGNTESGWVLLH